MRIAAAGFAALAALAAAGCASGGSAAPPETLSGGFVVVGIEGRLQPLERAGSGAPAAACAGTEGGGGAARLDRSRRFDLAVKQRDACGGEVERELSGTYVRRGEHLGFEARLSDGATLRFHGTTNDTTLVVRLSGAEIRFQRAGR
ncbi:MAG: hypothetical protein ABW277_21900 [Longimicrobiaceae bacterium]